MQSKPGMAQSHEALSRRLTDSLPGETSLVRFPSDQRPGVRRRPDLQFSPVALIVHFSLLLLQVSVTVWLVASLKTQSKVPDSVLSVLTKLGEQQTLVLASAAASAGASVSAGASPVGSTRQSHMYGLPRSMMPAGFKPFETLLKESKSTKNWHSMGHMYGEYLDPLRLAQGEVNMMEIGLQFGASLNLWFSAFPRGKVYGLEYNRLQLKQAAGDQTQARATIFRGDQTNVTLLREITQVVKKEVGLLDFIVDDGGHSMEQQIVSFTHLMPLIRPGGIYFIEDLQTSYWSTCHHHWNKEKYCYGGGPVGKKNTTIDMIKSFIDVINADFIEDHPNRDKLDSGVYTVNPSDRLIASVQCWRNMCAFRRKFEGSSF